MVSRIQSSKARAEGGSYNTGTESMRVPILVRLRAEGVVYIVRSKSYLGNFFSLGVLGNIVLSVLMVRTESCNGHSMDPRHLRNDVYKAWQNLYKGSIGDNR